MSVQKPLPNDRPRRQFRAAAPDAVDAWSLAVVTAALLLCSILFAKTLSFMVEGATASGPAVAAGQAPHAQSALRLSPAHRRALSEKFLRQGIDDIATGSILGFKAP
jgi:hypothetical protein